MTSYLLRRFAMLIAALVVTSVLVFLVMQVLPGDPATTLLGTSATPDAVAALQQQLGTDRALPARYAQWMGGLVGGDLGNSPVTGADIGQRIREAAGVTLSLVGLGMALSIIVAIPLGALAALRRHRMSGVAVSLASQIGVALPSFWVGVMLVAVFAVALRWFPANGYVPFSEDPLQWASRLILPVTALALVQSSVLVRYVRSALIDQMGQNYLRTAQATGMTRTSAVLWHGLPNAAVPVLTVLGVQVVTVLAGAVVIEQVFVLPGLGSLLVQSTANRDVFTVQSVVFLLVALGLVVSFLVDVAHLLIDPRLREAG